jgi:predicted TIM-barrel fold metal-dependent hydrolase
MQVPEGSWDCQVHVYGDPRRFPPRKQGAYQPPRAYFDDIHRTAKILGLGYVSIVQASIYGTDHSALLEALARGRDGLEGVRYRGIGIVDDTVTDRELEDLHAAGMRGVRFNFWKRLNVVPSIPTFRRTLERIGPLGWHARVHVTEPEILELQDEFRAVTNIQIVIDHMGHVPFAGGLGQGGVPAAKDLLARDNWWMMLSHGDRNSSTEAPWADSIELARAYYEIAPGRCVWATDWPHPEYPKTPVNDAELLELLSRQMGDAAALRHVLADNPARLHGELRL